MAFVCLIDAAAAQDLTAASPQANTQLPATTQLAPIMQLPTTTQLPTATPPPTVAQAPFTSQTRQTTPTTTGALYEPPLNPPVVGSLGGGPGALSLGPWLLAPTLGVYTLYDSNLYSSPTAPVRGPGLHIHPALSADYNTGIYETQLYGNIDSTVYPTLDYQNNTFNRQAGMIQKYSPLRDLVFTVQGDYIHNTAASVIVNSLPTLVSSAPAPSGTAGVVGAQQTVVNPNDVYTAQMTMYKEFNRAFMQVHGLVQETDFNQQSAQNYGAKAYDGSGGVWLTPQFYAYADGIHSYNSPEAGTGSNYFRTRAGIGSAMIGLFQGSVYYGQQGSEVNSGGKAGGDLYGGVISYFPTAVWNMSLGVDRLRNVSDITSGAGVGLGGLTFIPVGVTPNQSLQITTLTFKTNYTFSPQTSAFAVVSYGLIDQIHGPPLRDNSWFATLGVNHQISDHLTANFTYQYTRFMSPAPLTSLTHDLVTLGAVYSF